MWGCSPGLKKLSQCRVPTVCPHGHKSVWEHRECHTAHKKRTKTSILLLLNRKHHPKTAKLGGGLSIHTVLQQSVLSLASFTTLSTARDHSELTPVYTVLSGLTHGTIRTVNKCKHCDCLLTHHCCCRCWTMLSFGHRIALNSPIIYTCSKCYL